MDAWEASQTVDTIPSAFLGTDSSQALHPTWDLGPVHGHLHHGDAQLAGQVDELHVEAPPLQPRVAEQLPRRAARQQLRAGPASYHIKHHHIGKAHATGSEVCKRMCEVSASSSILTPLRFMPHNLPYTSTLDACMGTSSGHGFTLKPHWVSRTALPTTSMTSMWKPCIRKLRSGCRRFCACAGKRDRQLRRRDRVVHRGRESPIT